MKCKKRLRNAKETFRLLIYEQQQALVPFAKLFESYLVLVEVNCYGNFRYEAGGDGLPFSEPCRDG